MVMTYTVAFLLISSEVKWQLFTANVTLHYIFCAQKTIKSVTMSTSKPHGSLFLKHLAWQQVLVCQDYMAILYMRNY